MKPVLITTTSRGVFFGYLEEGNDHSPDYVVLNNGRNCIYWSEITKGFLGLASDGPDDQCRVGPKAETFKVFGITSIADVTPEAASKWEEAPWNPQT